MSLKADEYIEILTLPSLRAPVLAFVSWRRKNSSAAPELNGLKHRSILVNFFGLVLIWPLLTIWTNRL